MTLGILTFTEQGKKLAGKIKQQKEEKKLSAFSEIVYRDGQLNKYDQGNLPWLEEQFHKKHAILFIGATGIAVRMVAPFLEDKLSDSPVLVMDDCGNHVIPLLSGHVGGANAYAIALAQALEAVPVITTATDNHGLWAVDVFAKRNHLTIANKAQIACVSAKVLSGERVTYRIDGNLEEKAKQELSRYAKKQETTLDAKQDVATEVTLDETLDATLDMTPDMTPDIWITSDSKVLESATIKARSLLLVPQEYVLGMGCKKGKSQAELQTFAEEALAELGIQREQVRVLASIDRKKEEEGLLGFARSLRLPFVTYTAEELESVTEVSSKSTFVKETVGVDNVCERAALYTTGECGELVLPKLAKDGMTLAIARWRMK